MSDDRIQSFEEFWPFYLGEHRNPMNRKLHYIGTGFVLVIMALAVFTERYEILFAVPLMGYGFAWYGHFRVELNRPATFTYPIWSLMADFKMFYMAILGRMPAEMVKYYGTTSPKKDAPRLF